MFPPRKCVHLDCLHTQNGPNKSSNDSHNTIGRNIRKTGKNKVSAMDSRGNVCSFTEHFRRINMYIYMYPNRKEAALTIQRQCKNSMISSKYSSVLSLPHGRALTFPFTLQVSLYPSSGIRQSTNVHYILLPRVTILVRILPLARISSQPPRVSASAASAPKMMLSIQGLSRCSLSSLNTLRVTSPISPLCQEVPLSPHPSLFN